MNCDHKKWAVIVIFTLLGILTTISSPCFGQNKTQVQDQIVEHEAGFYYTIKKGDTLWDISQHFNDTPWMWPELWRENDQIPNPHWIYPGERIRLYHGKGQDKTGTKKEVPKFVPKAAIPAASLPDLAEREAIFRYPGIDGVGFIRKERLQSSGTVFKVKDNKVMISVGDLIFVKPPKNMPADYIVGSKYTIFRTIKPTKHKDSFQRYGTQYYILGIAEITRTESQYALAKVLKSFRDIRIDDQIMPYQKRSMEIPLLQGVRDLVGEIIVAEEHTGIIGDNTIAFIDKGKDDKILPGQQYNVYYQDKEILDGESKEEVPLVPIETGAVVVLHAERTTATVLITKSDRHLQAGTKIHAPPE
jgi:hypothetical protein